MNARATIRIAEHHPDATSASNAVASQSSVPPAVAAPAPEPPVTRRRHINWALKAILPIAAVLLNGLLLFILIALSLEIDQRHLIITVATAGAIVIFTAIIMVLSVSIRRPMLELQETIARVSLGDLTASVSFAKRNDEIGDLGRDFNDMIAQLKANREEIQRLHQTQMTRAEHFATLGELAAGLAHEIRNPLAGIAGVIEIVSRDLPPESPARAVIKDAKEEAVQINRILTDLLETARPKPPQFQVKDLALTINHAVAFARQQAITKGIHIDFDPGERIPLVEHDPNQMNQVLLNLLLNGIQAMDKPGAIHVSLDGDKESALITVADEGKGIAPEILPNIFRPFFTTKGHGTGLGLSLARRIVEAHGGTINVRSEVGKGTQFTVRLPMKKQPAE